MTTLLRIAYPICKRLKLKANKDMSTLETEQSLLEHFLRNSWQKMDDAHRVTIPAVLQIACLRRILQHQQERQTA